MRDTIHSLFRRLGVLWALALALLLAPAAFAGAEPEFANPPSAVPVGWEPPPLPDDWVEVSGVAFVAHGHAEDLALLDALEAHGSAALPRLARELGVPLGGTFHVFVADTPAEFVTLQPGSPPTWADGTAYPSIGAIYLRHPDLRGGLAKPLEQVLDHELVHVLLGRAFGEVPVPHWLQEGVAQVLAGETGPELPERIARGSMGAALFDLQGLERGFPSDPHRADLAYAQSADFIQWLGASYGPDALRDLIRLTREQRSLTEAVHRITGLPLDEIDARWRARLQATTPFFGSADQLEGFLWGAVGLMLLGVGASRKWTFWRRMRTWRDEDLAIDRIAREMIARRRGSTHV
ncbi:MAG: hypothetical protein H6733_04325 [Alphaproteobacteria bacterium]|nr:hypothetical protein [Alphaproteobacteria bacterium]